nr:ion channel [Saccharibacter sp. 17.LH.SD]
MKWPRFFLLVAGFYLFINFIFGIIYMVIPNSVTNVAPYDFWDDFFFSVQTLSTVGYGGAAPVGKLANTVVTVETFASMIFTSLVTGLIFSRFSRPHARVLFSKVATISGNSELPFLNIRIGNLRKTALIDLNVEAIMIHSPIDENGEPSLHIDRIQLQNNHLPLLPVSWVISHTITSDSPLSGLTTEDLALQKAQLIITLSATDQVSAQGVFAMHTYHHDSLIRDATFRNIIQPRPDGSMVADFGLFHATDSTLKEPLN